MWLKCVHILSGPPFTQKSLVCFCFFLPSDILPSSSINVDIQENKMIKMRCHICPLNQHFTVIFSQNYTYDKVSRNRCVVMQQISRKHWQKRIRIVSCDASPCDSSTLGTALTYLGAANEMMKGWKMFCAPSYASSCWVLPGSSSFEGGLPASFPCFTELLRIHSLLLGSSPNFTKLSELSEVLQMINPLFIHVL